MKIFTKVDQKKFDFSKMKWFEAATYFELNFVEFDCFLKQLDHLNN